MNARIKIIAKIAVFGGFILFSCLFGTIILLDPPAPSRVGDAPYVVNLKQLVDYRIQLEGQPVVILSWTSDFHVNATTGDVRFNVSDHFYNISRQVLLKAWAPGGVKPAGSPIGNGTYVVVKGICKLLSDAIIEGMEIHVLDPDNAYVVSISGLVVIVVMLFVYFRLDIKRLQFQVKTKPDKDRESGGA
ncbi:MAG: hypothetical protein Q6373_008795 [Candidatus Sigynarchaeota archaeon]